MFSHTEIRGELLAVSRQFLFLSFVNHLQSCASQQHQKKRARSRHPESGIGHVCSANTLNAHIAWAAASVFSTMMPTTTFLVNTVETACSHTTQTPARQAVFSGGRIKPKDVSSMKQMKKTFGSTAQQEFTTVLCINDTSLCRKDTGDSNQHQCPNAFAA